MSNDLHIVTVYYGMTSNCISYILKLHAGARHCLGTLENVDTLETIAKPFANRRKNMSIFLLK